MTKSGKLFVPKLSSYNVLDITKAINPKAKIKYIGIRPGEKVHEELKLGLNNSQGIDSDNDIISIDDKYL